MNVDLSRLKETFDPDSIEWRVQRSGKKGDKAWAMVLAYITNRAIMDRLDEVCGPGNWKNEYKQAPEGGILCGISIRIGDEWVTKWDGAENTDIEAVKGGLSGAMKRSAVQWGIGRYLYKLESTFVDIGDRGANRIFDKKNGINGRWDPPKLPKWALPKGTKQASRREPQETRQTDPPAASRAPKSDKTWAELSTKQKQAIGIKFRELAAQVQWAPKYEDVYDWAEQNNALGISEAKGRASIDSSTKNQIDRCIATMERLIRGGI